MSSDDLQPDRGSPGSTVVPGKHAEPSKPAKGKSIGGIFLMILGLVLLITGVGTLQFVTAVPINQNPVTGLVMALLWLVFIAVSLGGATCLVIGASLLLGRANGTASVVRHCFRLVISTVLGIVGLVILVGGVAVFVQFQDQLNMISSLSLIFAAAGGLLAYKAIRSAMASCKHLRERWAERKQLAADPGQ